MRLSYDPVYYDTPAVLQMSQSNQQDPNAAWYDPTYVDAYGRPIDPYNPSPVYYDANGTRIDPGDPNDPIYSGMSRTAARAYDQPGQFPPTYRYGIRPRLGRFVDSQVVNPQEQSEDYYDPRYDYYQQERRSEELRRRSPDYASSIGSSYGARGSSLQQEYMRSLAMRAMLLAQQREKTLKEKLLEDYFARVLRSNGAPI